MFARLCHEGVVSVYSFIAGLGLLFVFTLLDLVVLLDLTQSLLSYSFPVRLLLLTLYFIVLIVVLYCRTSLSDFQVSD